MASKYMAQPVQPFTTNKESVGQHLFRRVAQRPLAQVFALPQPTLAGGIVDLLLLFLRHAKGETGLLGLVGFNHSFQIEQDRTAQRADQGVRGMCPLQQGSR